MGADIHAYVDFFRPPSTDDGWPTIESFGGRFRIGRDYILFGMLTNGQVRVEDGVKGYAPDPKGAPSEMSRETYEDYSLRIYDEIPDWMGEEERACTFDKASQWVNSYGCQWVKNDTWGNWREDRKPTGITYLESAPEKSQYGWYEAEVTDPDWHSHSWLDTKELARVVANYPAVVETFYKEYSRRDRQPSFTLQGVLAAMTNLDYNGCNPRFVYWFDN